MASGLDNLFTTYGSDYGALGAYQGGQRRGLADSATRLANEQKMAETQRYTGETPSYLQKAGAQARAAELANIQPEADLAAGVPGAKAQENLMTSKQKAQEAEMTFNRAPAAEKLKYLDQTSQYVTKFNELGLQLLSTSNSTAEAIQRMVETYPDVAKDPTFKQWAQKYGNMPLDQATNEFKFTMQKYASGIATTREKFQAEALQQDQRGQQALEQGAQRAQFGLQEAQTRAAASGEGKENTTMAIRRLSAIIADPNTTEEQKVAAEYELTAHLKYGQQIETSPLGAQFDRSKEKTLPPRPVNKPAVPDANLAKLPKGSKALGNGVYQLPDGTKVKAN